jgi:hypothetical protein
VYAYGYSEGDTTGTGNSLNEQHPHTLQLIMDSLRYWITEMHVDRDIRGGLSSPTGSTWISSAPQLTASIRDSEQDRGNPPGSTLARTFIAHSPPTGPTTYCW